MNTEARDGRSDDEFQGDRRAMQFVTVQSSAQFAIGRELFREYADALSVDLCFQGFDAELASLEQMYAAPRGRLLFAMVDGEVAGCVAVRALDGENYGPGGWCSDDSHLAPHQPV